jgi:uncharacterized coiled-coil protein SlyX
MKKMTHRDRIEKLEARMAEIEAKNMAYCEQIAQLQHTVAVQAREIQSLHMVRVEQVKSLNDVFTNHRNEILGNKQALAQLVTMVYMVISQMVSHSADAAPSLLAAMLKLQKMSQKD